MNSSVIVFPGSNCDRDMDVALKKFGFKNKMVWHNDSKLPKSDLVVLPGGFSYGDYLRCGSMASKSKIIESVINFAKSGGLFIGMPSKKGKDNKYYDQIEFKVNGFRYELQTRILEAYKVFTEI